MELKDYVKPAEASFHLRPVKSYTGLTWTGAVPSLWTTRLPAGTTIDATNGPQSIIFNGADGQPAVTFKHTGEVVLGPGYTATDAGDAVLKYIRNVLSLPTPPATSDLAPGQLDLPDEMPEVLAKSVQYAAGEFSRRNYEAIVEASKGKTPFEP